MSGDSIDYVVAPPPTPVLPVLGGGRFPVRRIFCVGKNYADHVREMGGQAERDPPVFFTKPADAATASGRIPYPPATQNLHYEAELVLALGAGGRDLSAEAAQAAVFGYAAGCDLTRRDLQTEAKAAGNPWDAAKAFDLSAPVGEIAPAAEVDLGGAHLGGARIVCLVNGARRQDAALADMIFPPTEILRSLSRLFALAPGDLVFTGTPAGVGPLRPGDAVEAVVDGLPPLAFEIADPS